MSYISNAKIGWNFIILFFQRTQIQHFILPWNTQQHAAKGIFFVAMCKICTNWVVRYMTLQKQKLTALSYSPVDEDMKGKDNSSVFARGSCGIWIDVTCAEDPSCRPKPTGPGTDFRPHAAARGVRETGQRTWRGGGRWLTWTMAETGAGPAPLFRCCTSTIPSTVFYSCCRFP